MKSLKLTYFLALLAIALTPFKGLTQEKDSTYYQKQKAPGVKKIWIDGKFWVWTQKVGDGKIPVLLLHGGPAQSHEYFEIFSHYLPSQGITIYYYDQFGSYFSEIPTTAQLKDTSIWKVSRYIDEIEQVRKGLGLNKLFIYGHSYGALLALAYTHRYQEHVKGLIFSDMNPDQLSFGKDVNAASKRADSLMSTSAGYQKLMQSKLRGSYDTTAYQDGFDKTFTRNFVVRLDTLPEALERTKKHKNFEVAKLIGPSTFSLNYVKMVRDINVPVLLMCGGYDFIITRDELVRLSKQFQNAECVIVPNGGHICFVDDPNDYFPALISFIKRNK
jgi:proline iminopeptidase